MATFLFSDRADGDIILFNPDLDVLRFDTTLFSAADAVLDTPTVTSTRFTAGGKTFTLVGLGLAQITASNITFDDGSQVLVGPLLSGTAGDDQLFGTAGDDVLDGGNGADRMAGGSGDDTYVVTSLRDQVVELSGQGLADTVQSSITLSLSPNVEDLELLGSSAINGFGNALSNVLIGNAGANRLQGRAGDDFLIGGAGNDSLEGGTGIDTASYADATGPVTASIGTFDAALQAVRGSASGAGVGTDRLLDIERLIGSGFNDSLTGSTGANRLDGLDGDDTLIGGDGNDDLAGGTGFDTASYAAATGPVTVDLAAFPFAFFPGFAVGPGVGSDGLRDIEAVIGSAFADSLRGDSAANRLDSGAGADTMAGGAGDDTYVVNSLLDQVTELAGAGVDSALSGISLSLYANLESLTLLGAAAIDGTGNLLANTLTGNGAGNRLLGLGGGDLLAGGAGNDTLDGGTGFDTASFLGATAALTVNLAAGTATGQGADTLSGIEAVIGGGLADTLIGDAQANRLDGQAGADSMSGGAGDDTYLVDNALDRITELAGGGADSVQSSVSLALAAEVENLTLLGSGALNGDGNPLANVLNGTAGVNRLRGGNGNDTLSAATATTGWTAEWATTPPASPARRVASSRICPPAALRGVAAGSTP